MTACLSDRLQSALLADRLELQIVLGSLAARASKIPRHAWMCAAVPPHAYHLLLCIQTLAPRSLVIDLDASPELENAGNLDQSRTKSVLLDAIPTSTPRM